MTTDTRINATSQQTDCHTRYDGHGAARRGLHGSRHRTRLVQIIGNLLGNAIRYTPDAGHIQVALQLHGTSLGLEVADDGIGISSELMPKFFDLYMQGEPSSTARTGGLGLGLALVRSLVEIHHGSVSATSAGVGKGSVFRVILPLDAGLQT